MVYCGKPSRGCQMCRTRRIKCDEAKPTCHQCAKSRRQCPGYKDEFDLVFRNETLATERRAWKANRKALAQQKEGKHNKPSESSLISPTPSPTAQALEKSPSVSAALGQPVEQQAACHFVANFVLVPNNGSTRGFLEFIPLIVKSGNAAPHFRYAFDACALASLGNRVAGGGAVEEKALGLYTKALASTHYALKNPEMAKSDDTLASILLLGLFESISAKQLGTLAWGSHTEGATQLVKSRGRKQLRTKVGLALFIAVRTQMIVHTLSSGKAPIMGVEWWINDASRNEHASLCQKNNIRVGELRAEVNRLMSTMSRDPANINFMLGMIRKCQVVDQDCVTWAEQASGIYRWRTVAWVDEVPQGNYASAEVFPGRVDVYQDLWLASVWNLMRCSRIILASLIVRCAAWICSPMDYRTTHEYATAVRVCSELITDIIASVPYQLGWFSKRRHLLDRASCSSFECGSEDALKGLPGYFLTWPLTCIQGQDYTTDIQRTWIRGRLTFIANQLGVRYASMLIQLDVRIPSMLIRRDGLMADPFATGHNFEKLLSTHNASRTNSINGANSVQARDARLIQNNQRKTQSRVKARTRPDRIGGWASASWLHAPNLKSNG